MTAADWTEMYGDGFLFSLTNEDREYFALNAVPAASESVTFFRKEGSLHTRVTVFFEGDCIVKVINETLGIGNAGGVWMRQYEEYDTKLFTDGRNMLLPLTSRGKPKKLTASNVNAVTPFGRRLYIRIRDGRNTEISLTNPRGNKRFPIGEWEAVEAIRSEADFRSFVKYYISTCREDYFEKLRAFRSAQKVTVKYRPGDIFRMDYDRTRCCYGIITGEISQIKAMPELPEKHSLRQLMMVPIMVRAYQLLTENPNLTADDLLGVPLGRVQICGDNDIIWGTHTIVDHRQLAPEDLEFNLVCTKILSPSPHTTLFTQDSLLRDGLIPKQEYTLYIEWGFAQTSLRYDQLSDRLKEQLADYASPHGGVFTGIDPRSAVPDEKQRQLYAYRRNLLNPENREIRGEIFACLGLGADTTFDRFAQKYGGLSLQEIAARMTAK